MSLPSRLLLIANFLPLCGCQVLAQLFPSETTIEISSHSQLNPNNKQKPSPVILRIFELKDIEFFQNSSFIDLYDGQNPTLKKALTAQHEKEIWPKSKMSFTFSLKSETKYIGMVAAYRRHSEQSWKTLSPVDSGSSQTITVILRENKIYLKKKD